MGTRRIAMVALTGLLLVAAAMPAGAASRSEARFGHLKLSAKERTRVEKQIRQIGRAHV